MPAERGIPTAPTAPAPRTDGADAVLDERTFSRVLQPGSDRRLPLGDGEWHQLARAYVWVRLIAISLVLVPVLVAAGVLAAVTASPWPWVAGGAVGVVLLWAAAITPRQARAYAYRLRADDLVFRHGILWQRMVAVPYGRMQLVDITHGPLDRAFGIAQVKLVTAAATTGVVIPGLTQGAAERLRDILIDVAESRRTGL